MPIDSDTPALLDGLTLSQAESYALVLAAKNIACQIHSGDSGWQIQVPEELREIAGQQIQHYRRENPETPFDPLTPRPAFDRSWVLVVLILATIHVVIDIRGDRRMYIEAFGASARLILQGKYYRGVTALLLHANYSHLLSNLVGLWLFGGAVATRLGPGLGWFLILVTGAGGNLANAWLYGSGHLSIGASTAVFGALGLMCAMSAFDARGKPRGLRHRLLVVGAGLAILAMLGASAKTDVMAHLFGFLVGGLVGLPCAWRLEKAPRTAYQVALGLLTAALLVASWHQGMGFKF
jgi:rhomboid protease GluP